MTDANVGGRVTIYDVASKAGVSTATASKALNDTGRMAAETRARIRRVAEELEAAQSKQKNLFLIIFQVILTLRTLLAL